MSRRSRRRLRQIAIGMLAVTGALLLIDLHVGSGTEDRVFRDVQRVPAMPVALVLGTLKFLGKDAKRSNPSAAALYHTGKVRGILVSGDNFRHSYNGPQAMTEDLVSLGVPADHIKLDFAGFRTLDSIVRSKHVFGQSAVIVVFQAAPRPMGIGEPATTPLGEFRGDTVHVDVIDRDGNMVAATPSGGWLQSALVVPGQGIPLGIRAQMIWLLDGHPNGLTPGKRPRTTLTPTIATRDGDQQEQWPLQFLLNHQHFDMDIQTVIEAPEYQTTHFPSSFYPRP